MIVIGTRGSALALAQARIVARALGDEVQLRVIHTAGDASDRPIRELGDGVFVGAVEDALLRGDVDVAVHSLKDLPTAEAPGLAIAAIPAREDPRDVLITADRRGLAGLRPNALVGTSSPRREAFLRALAPGIATAEIRGNVDTRLRKVMQGEYDATVLAAAGLRRLGIAFDPDEALDLATFPCAPGQGALAVQTRADDPRRRQVRDALDHTPTRRAVEAERETLRLAGATCAIPMGCYGRSEGDDVVLDAAVATATGIRRAHARGREPSEVARTVARDLGVLVHA